MVGYRFHSNNDAITACVFQLHLFRPSTQAPALLECYCKANYFDCADDKKIITARGVLLQFVVQSVDVYLLLIQFNYTAAVPTKSNLLTSSSGRDDVGQTL